MKSKYPVLLYFLLFSIAVHISHAQQRDTLYRFEVYYSVNSDEINWKAEHKIDSVFKKLSAPRNLYYVSVTGFADSVGSQNRNEELAAARAQKIATYFEKYGFKGSRISFKGVPKTVNKDDQERKVQVNIMVLSPSATRIAGKEQRYQEFKFDDQIGANFTTASQTNLFVSNGAFSDKAGNPAKKPYTILYKEYRDTLAFLLRGIPLNSKKPERLYNSTGMFELRAYSGKQPVYLVQQKPIGMLFGLNERKPLLDLYYYNDSLNDWEYLQHITDEKGNVSPYRYDGPGCGGVIGYCEGIDACDRLVFLVDNGMKYIANGTSIAEELKKNREIQLRVLAPIKKKLDSLNQEINSARSKLETQRKRHRSLDTIIYRVERIKISRKKSEFHVFSEVPHYNETAELNGMNFISKKQLPDSIYKAEWNYCRINASGGRYNLLLQLNGRKYKLQELKMKKDKVLKPEVDPENAFGNYKKQVKEREKQAKAVADSIQVRTERLEILKKLQWSVDSLYQEELNKLDNKALRDLDCFWHMNRRFMDSSENRLKFDDWIAYFDGHRPLMKKRFEKLKGGKPSSYERCKKLVNNRDSLMARIDRLMPTIVSNRPHADSLPKRDTVILRLSIKKLGVYNVASPRFFSIQPSELIKTSAFLYKKDTLNIIRVWIVDKYFNGFYEFGHNPKYSPYLLPASAFSNVRLIAFDENKKVFYSPLLDLSQLRSNNSNTLELLPLGNISSLFPLFKVAR